MQKLIIAAAFITLTASCASKKSLVALQTQNQQIQTELSQAKTALADAQNKSNACDTKLADATKQLSAKDADLQSRAARLKELEDQVEFLKKNNNALFDRLSDLSVVSKAGAESVKKSIEALNDQSKYIQNLNSSIQRKDSINLALVNNLKRSLGNVSDEDVQIEVKKGVVYVSLSDNMLFKFGSFAVSSSAENVLEKVAKILNDYKEIDILVEGHTDNVPFSGEGLIDNWDLSVKRATSVARLLQNKFKVDPARMIAGGRGEYMPKVANTNGANRSQNRRTEIVITPKLDQFFNLAVPNAGK
jgi:chemotaxis protein MotB